MNGVQKKLMEPFKFRPELSHRTELSAKELQLQPFGPTMEPDQSTR